MIVSEYTTVSDVRSAYLKITGTGDDALLLDFIREASDMINSAAKVHFYPKVETRNFNVPRGGSQWPLLPTRYDLLTDNSKLGGVYTSNLVFDRPLLEVLTLTNGDGSTLASSTYWLYDINFYPKRALKLKPTSGKTWLLDSAGNWEQVIGLTGVWGYHEHYLTAWQDTGLTLNDANFTSSSTALATTGTATLKAGQLVKLDSEYLYVSSGSASPYTVTRGVNGSTAASHSNGAGISVWTLDSSLSSLARVVVAAMLRIRENPIGDSINIDGHVIQTPRDLQGFIDSRIDRLGVGWEVTG